jgi:acetyl esterase/lipase
LNNVVQLASFSGFSGNMVDGEVVPAVVGLDMCLKIMKSKKQSPRLPSGSYGKMFGHDHILPSLETGYVKRKWLDLPYATQSPAQKLDLYLPDGGKGPFPLLVTFHGGAWMFGDKGHAMSLPFLEGLKRGYAVACVNYRLSGEAKFPSQIYDCKAAVRYLRANAVKYHLDGKRVGAWGASAGGYLAALLGTSAKVKQLEDQSIKNSNSRTTPQVQAVVVWYGPIENFLTMDDELSESGMGRPIHSRPDSAESRLLGRTITDVPAFVNFASPMTYIDANAPPFLIQHGLQDEIVPVQQSIRFATELENIAGSEKVTLDIFNGAKHADRAFETPLNIQRVLDFLDTHLK